MSAGAARGRLTLSELPLPAGSWSDNARRLSIGKPPLFKQGQCLVCGIALAGPEDTERDVCGCLYCNAKIDHARMKRARSA